MVIAEPPTSNAPACPAVMKLPAAQPCTNQLPELNGRQLVIGRSFLQPDVVPCDIRELWIGTERPPGPGASYERLAVCAKWSVEPTSLATIDKEGRLIVSAAAAGRTLFVTAMLPNKETLSTSFSVADASVAPLIGNWHEVARLSCKTNKWVVPKEPIGQLHISAAGGFVVTWAPAPLHADYSGDYTYDGKNGALKLANLDGDYVPKDVVTKGTARIESGKLVLSGIYLGSKGEGSRACGHRFAK